MHIQILITLYSYINIFICIQFLNESYYKIFEIHISSNHPVALIDTHTHKHSTNTSSSHIAATKQHGKHKDTEQWPLRGKRENGLTNVNIHCVAKSFRKIFRLLNEISQMFLVNDEIKSLPNNIMTCAIHFPWSVKRQMISKIPQVSFKMGFGIITPLWPNVPMCRYHLAVHCGKIRH